jgi:signal recognition particle GTPase
LHPIYYGDIVEKDTLDHLRTNIQTLLSYLAEYRQRNKLLLEEKRELEALLIEKERRIEGLQKLAEDLKANSDQNEVEKYKHTEKKLKKRLEEMLSKLENLDLLD